MAPIDLYAAYVRERTGSELEIDDGRGFATWRLLFEEPKSFAEAQQQANAGTIAGGPAPRDAYLVDIYVAPDFRKAGVATALCARVAEKAKARGATRLLGSVETRGLTRSDATKAILAAGFELTHVEGSMIWFAKGLA